MLVAMSILTGKASDFLRVAAAAAGRGDLDTVGAVLAEKPAWVGRIGSHGRTLLWEAAYRGRLEMVDYLLDRGADIDACGCHFTPLLVEISPYCAARYRRHEAVAERLIERGAATDIYTAAFLGDRAAVVEYLEREPRLATAEKPQHDGGRRATTLHYAVSARHLDIVTTLLARGADPRPYSGWLIRFAIWRDRADILAALIDGGADPTRAEVPRSGVSAEIAAVLAAHGAGVSVDHAEGGWPPLVFQARGDRGGNVDRVRDLLDRARPMAQKELAFLRGFAENELGLEDLQRWDLAWVSERARAAELGLKDEELKPYFAADATVAGMLELAAGLFRLEIARRDGVASWHPDVQFYELREAGGELLGQFYLDPYARAGKHGGAWMDACAQRRRRGDGVQPAVAYLTCNAAPPAGDAPALLTHSDAVTLFHEFGHGLHHMLTRVDCAGVSGIEGVEWDAVEWPSQWMENWCWEPAALRRFACHYRTGEAMPEELLDRLQASRRFNAGLALMRQLEFALFDFRLHLEYRPDRGPRVAELLAEIRRDIDLLEVPEFVRTAHSFEHIFSGGYTDGYYSYKWAEVLSGDTFEAFQEEGLFNPETARRFCDCMLAAGGVRPAAEMFEAFRGRPPHPGALLRQMGLAA